MRIVSLCPSLTELVFDLGRGDDLVGITKYCVHPADGVDRRACREAAQFLRAALNALRAENGDRFVDDCNNYGVEEAARAANSQYDETAPPPPPAPPSPTEEMKRDWENDGEELLADHEEQAVSGAKKELRECIHSVGEIAEAHPELPRLAAIRKMLKVMELSLVPDIPMTRSEVMIMARGAQFLIQERAADLESVCGAVQVGLQPGCYRRSWSSCGDVRHSEHRGKRDARGGSAVSIVDHEGVAEAGLSPRDGPR